MRFCLVRFIIIDFQWGRICSSPYGEQEGKAQQRKYSGTPGSMTKA